ncbi:MAG: flagellar hook-associated protein FlgK [Deferribacteres bacterium]|nr:flagellar hook-associated protein FlgK [Deferribacteres bacterium]
MSLLGLFDIGRSGIYANQKALRVSSNNIANVNTPGYSRQDVVMRIANPIEMNGNYLGRGVGKVDIRRAFDGFIFYQILGQSSSYGKSFSVDRGMSHVEQIFNEAQDFGLSNAMTDYFNAWQEVAANPHETAQRSMLLVKAEAFVNTAKQMENDLKNTLNFVNDEIKDVVDQINVLTKNIATVNGKIIEVEAGGVETANVFRDQREQMMKELAELIDYDWYEDKDGSVSIVAGRGSIVAGVQSYELSTALNLEGDRNVYHGKTDITSFFHSGRLGGYVSLRNDIKSRPLLSLRKLVASIIEETNYLHKSSSSRPTYDLDGNAGTDFFDAMKLYTRDDTTGGSGAVITSAAIYDYDPSVLALNEYDITFVDVSGTLNYQVRNHETGALVKQGAYTSGDNIDFNGIRVVITDGSSAPSVNDSFFVSPLKSVIENFKVAVTSGRQVAAAKSSSALPGDNTNALDIIDKYTSQISNLGSVTYEDYYAETVSTVGSLSQSASDSLEFEDNLLFELKNRRESVSGVSLDEEAANLIRYQRAFEAGARIIKLTDELLEMIINI